MDDESALRAAAHCDDCIGWLHHCKAACCLGFRFRVSPDSDIERGSDAIRIRVRMNDDLRRYIELHGAAIEVDRIVVPLECCSEDGDRLHVTMRCSALTEDLLCSLHPNGKPEGCIGMTLDGVRAGEYWAPDSCLFTYKLRLEHGELAGPTKDST